MGEMLTSWLKDCTEQRHGWTLRTIDEKKIEAREMWIWWNRVVEDRRILGVIMMRKINRIYKRDGRRKKTKWKVMTTNSRWRYGQIVNMMQLTNSLYIWFQLNKPLSGNPNNLRRSLDNDELFNENLIFFIINNFVKLFLG